MQSTVDAPEIGSWPHRSTIISHAVSFHEGIRVSFGNDWGMESNALYRNLSDITIRPPANEADMRQICVLNHDIFARELAQHRIHDDGLLVDKFHAKNDYLGAWRGNEIVGMLAAHAEPPFSAVERFGAPLLAVIGTDPIAEIRLFAVRPEYRRSMLAIKLGNAMFQRLVSRGIPRAMISGIAEQRKLYTHLGFKVAGEPVQEGEHLFYPMVGQLEEMLAHYAKISERLAL